VSLPLFCAVVVCLQEDFVIELSSKQCSLESVVGPFNFNIRGQISGWNSTTGAMDFQFTAVDILLMGKKVTGSSLDSVVVYELTGVLWKCRL